MPYAEISFASRNALKTASFGIERSLAENNNKHNRESRIVKTCGLNPIALPYFETLHNQEQVINLEMHCISAHQTRLSLSVQLFFLSFFLSFFLEKSEQVFEEVHHVCVCSITSCSACMSSVKRLLSVQCSSEGECFATPSPFAKGSAPSVKWYSNHLW